MNTTIAICTFNRADVLPRAVRAAAAQTVPRDGYEILVVDNNSTDNTEAVVRELEREVGGIRLCREEKQGLSHARNRAIAEARGEMIVYVDDDAEMVPGYLASLDLVVREERDLGAAGGPIEVGWLGPVPEWYEPPMDVIFNQLQIASFRTQLRYPKILYGTNMAFPLNTLRELGGFDTRLGPIGSFHLVCDDGEMLLRLQTKAHKRVLWDPALRVRHLIHPKRLTIEYMLRKSEWGGRSQCILESLYPGRGNLRGAVLGLLESFARIVLSRRRGRIFERMCLAYNWGYIRQRFQRPPLPPSSFV